MDEHERLISALGRIKATIVEVQDKFSEAAEIFNRKKSCDLSHLPNCQQVVEYINYRNQISQKDYESLTEDDRLIMDGDQIKEFITNTQARFLFALKVINDGKLDKVSEDQVRKAQLEINQATLDIIEYNDLLRLLYEVLKIHRSGE